MSDDIERDEDGRRTGRARRVGDNAESVDVERDEHGRIARGTPTGALKRAGGMMRVARWLDIVAVLVILAAIARFVVLPRLRYEVLTVQAPPVSIATLDGGRFDLEHRRGHLVFLDFWTTWCPPCRESIPLVQHFRRTHPDVDVVSIDVGEDPVVVRPFAARFKMDDVALDPDQTVSHAFAVAGFPTLIAVDGTGRVRARWYGYLPDIERQMQNVVTRYGPAAPTTRLRR